MHRLRPQRGPHPHDLPRLLERRLLPVTASTCHVQSARVARCQLARLRVVGEVVAMLFRGVRAVLCLQLHPRAELDVGIVIYLA